MADDQTLSRRPARWRILGWSVPVLLLLLPLVAMQFTDEVHWTGSDFVFAGVLFGGVGLAFEAIARSTTSLAYRTGAVTAVIAALLTIWANGAVGMIGSEDNPYNLVFGGVLLIALLGAILSRFQAGGMALTMLAAAAAQALAAGIGFSADARGGVFSFLFVGMWLLSAALFGSAKREQDAA